MATEPPHKASAETSSDANLRDPETFRELIHLRRTRRDMRFRPGNKIKTYGLVQRLGFETPKLFRVYDRASDVSLDDLPEAVVLKPHNLAAMRGVFVLHRIAGAQSWFDAVSQRRLWESDVRAAFVEWEKLALEDKRGDFKIIAEERVVGTHNPSGIPLDYKIYCFDGEPRLIIQIDRNTSPVSIALHDRDFSPWSWSDHVELGRGQAQPGDLVMPANPDRMLTTVSELSKKLQTPFCRIDMYDAARGVLVGELTPAPGGPYFAKLYAFKPAFDRSLFDSWRAAAERLGQPLGQIADGETIPARSRFLPSRKQIQASA